MDRLDTTNDGGGNEVPDDDADEIEKLFGL